MVKILEICPTRKKQMLNNWDTQTRPMTLTSDRVPFVWDYAFVWNDHLEHVFFLFQIWMCVLAIKHVMEPPRDSTELSYLIDSYLVRSDNGELFKGSLLANFKDKSNAEFCEYLRHFYGDRWSDSFIRRMKDETIKGYKDMNLTRKMGQNFLSSAHLH